MSNYVRCKSPFATFERGYPDVVKGGEVLADDDPRVLKSPTNFEPVDAQERRRAESTNLIRGPQRFRGQPRQRAREVEQATAAPGERRNVVRPDPDDDRDDPQERDDSPPQTALTAERPADYAPKSAWVHYARGKGFSGDENDVTKRELIEQYG